MAYGLGAVGGPLIGGAFTSEVTWRWVRSRRPLSLDQAHTRTVLLDQVRTPPEEGTLAR